jgi:hypothetical protein
MVALIADQLRPVPPASAPAPGRMRWVLPLSEKLCQGLTQAVNLCLEHGHLPLGHRLGGFPGFGDAQLRIGFCLCELLLKGLDLSVGLKERLLETLHVGTHPSSAVV